MRDQIMSNARNSKCRINKIDKNRVGHGVCDATTTKIKLCDNIVTVDRGIKDNG